MPNLAAEYTAPAPYTPSKPAAFVAFNSWAEVLALPDGAPLWYWAPLDRRPFLCAVVRQFKNGKVRIDPLSRDARAFTIDAGHMDRLLRSA